MSEFSELGKDDKIGLLVDGFPKIISLLSVLNFNFEEGFWTLPLDNENAAQLSMDIIKNHELLPTEIHYKFMQKVQQECKSDMIMLDLLSAVLLFNPNGSILVHKHFITLQQKTYMYLLQRYLEIKHNSKSESETRFRRLMNCMNDLHLINEFRIQNFTIFGV
ncbi:unnamed protein product [Oppiella nova]|uniref:NR LBD domain-containing protein n=1 Tax=Oppiella nova TaxID=334625 RepID=A0A7R9MHV9_9ACAR|nr:unnamed protein product [Oppiella nova]CAG2176496.1 unnamed protein product [Oppiella nova]